MHVVFLGMNYPPESTGIAPYTGGIAEHLAERGHRVTVLTTFPHYPSWQVDAAFRGRRRSVGHRSGVHVRRAAVYLPAKGSTLQRVLYDSSLAGGTLLSGIGVPRADLVFCVSPPIQLGLTAALLARRWGAPLVLQLQDLPLDAAQAVGMLRPGPVMRLGRSLERLVYRLSDRLLVISEGFRQSVLRQGVPAEKVSLIPNWADVDTVRPIPPDAAMRSLAGAGPDDFLVLHTGNMGEKQGLSSAVLASAELSGRPPFRLTLVGDGMDRAHLEKLATSRGIKNVGFLPLQPADIFPRLLASADAVLLNQRADVVDSVAPSKLLSYLAAGRPVVAAIHPESEAAAVIRISDSGVIVAPEDPGALAAGFRSLAADPARRQTLGKNGRRYAERHFARGAVLQRLEELLLQTAAGGR